jgi:hypothetical protein
MLVTRDEVKALMCKLFSTDHNSHIYDYCLNNTCHECPLALASDSELNDKTISNAFIKIDIAFYEQYIQQKQEGIEI